MGRLQEKDPVTRCRVQQAVKYGHLLEVLAPRNRDAFPCFAKLPLYLHPEWGPTSLWNASEQQLIGRICIYSFQRSSVVNNQYIEHIGIRATFHFPSSKSDYRRSQSRSCGHNRAATIVVVCANSQRRAKGATILETQADQRGEMYQGSHASSLSASVGQSSMTFGQTKATRSKLLSKAGRLCSVR
jgi:hypothetical protein